LGEPLIWGGLLLSEALVNRSGLIGEQLLHSSSTSFDSRFMAPSFS
jgi:hypothetical protein